MLLVFLLYLTHGSTECVGGVDVDPLSRAAGQDVEGATDVGQSQEVGGVGEGRPGVRHPRAAGGLPAALDHRVRAAILFWESRTRKVM